MVDTHEFLLQQRAQVEKNAAEATKIWRKYLEKIRAHRNDLIQWTNETVDKTDHLSPDAKTIEKKAFTDLLDMTPEQVGQLTITYYDASRVSPYSEHGWTPALEAQMHYTINIIERVQEQGW